MSTDLRPYIGAYTGQGQTTLSEGAPAQWYNCTIECLRRTALDLHFNEPYDDEQLRNSIAARYGYTGLPWGASVDIANALIPGLSAVMAIESPTDIVAQIRANVAAGYLQHCGFWCDMNAWVPALGAVTYSHACRITADLGGGFALQNPEPHPDFTLTDMQVRSLWDRGGLLVFKKSVIATMGGGGGFLAMLTDDQQKSLFDMIQVIYRQLSPLTPDQEKSQFDMIQILYRDHEAEKTAGTG